MKQSRRKILSPAESNAQFSNRTLRATATALLACGLLLFWLQPASAQQETRAPTPPTAPTTAPNTAPTKADLEYQKLQLEVAKLQQEDSPWTKWIPLLLGILGGAIGASSSLWVARRAREGAIDQATHQKRLNSYPELIKATASLALYFPEFVYSSASLSPDDCRAMGRQMSRWYFDGGGLLLSVPARDAYFTLARALTRASFATELRVPNFRQDALLISREKMDEYCETLGDEFASALDDVDAWSFIDAAPETLEKQTPSASASTANVERFKDYVFLQHLSSRLRTALADDLRSRRRLS